MTSGKTQLKLAKETVFIAACSQYMPKRDVDCAVNAGRCYRPSPRRRRPEFLLVAHLEKTK